MGEKKTLKTSENQLDLSDVILETLAWINYLPISSWFFFNVYGSYLSTMWELSPGNLTSFFLVPC